MCVPDGIIVFLLDRALKIRLNGAAAPDSFWVGGPLGIFKRQKCLAQSSGGTRTSCR
jgi:hypothetical protein